MKFGVNTLIWTVGFDRSHLPLIPRIKEHGFDGVQIPMLRPADYIAADIRKATEENGLALSVCPFFIDGLSLISEDESLRKKTQAHLREVIKVAAEAGAESIAGPLYCPVGYLPGRRRNDDEWKWAVEGYQSAVPALVEYGLTMGVESLNRFETYFLNTADDLAKITDAVGHPSVGVLYDTFHGNIEDKSVPGAIRTIGKRLQHVHACENDRGIPGTGHQDWNGIFQALRDIHFDGWLTIESFAFTLGDLAASAAIWRDLAPTPEHIAFEGIKFLRQNFAPAAA
ncbi:MAG: sugar phosphate isomerase/epimerase family protein [Candidatus Solibacter sp.]